MACFLVPMFLAIGTTIFGHVKKVNERLKLSVLNWMLWGGVVMLAVEHIAHQEIVPFPPFLTAMKTAEETAVMLNEMATIGGAMTLIILAAWAVIVGIGLRTASLSGKPSTE